MLLTVGGTLLAFGCNRHGCLGVGDEMDRDIPTPVSTAATLLPNLHASQ